MKVVKNVRAYGNYVVLKGSPSKKEIKEETTKSGMVLLDGSSAVKGKNPQNAVSEKEQEWSFKIHDIGSGVDLEKSGFKVGDVVFFNQYDAKYIGKEERNIHILIQSQNIMATYSEEEVAFADLDEYFEKEGK